MMNASRGEKGRRTVTLRDIMSPDVITVHPEMTLREVIEVLTDRSVSGAPVVAGDRVVGVISATDVLEFEAATPGVPTERGEQTEWGELEPETWEEGTEAPADYYSEMWSDVGAEVLERFGQEGPEWDVLREHTASEAMTRTLCALPPDTEVPAAAQYMLKAAIHRVLVVEDARLIGIVTTTDIVRAVAERRL
jgi:CBS domain-containing protein